MIWYDFLFSVYFVKIPCLPLVCKVTERFVTSQLVRARSVAEMACFTGNLSIAV